MVLDKNFFSKGTHEQLSQETKMYLQTKSLAERLQIGTYLTSVAYGFEGKPFPKMEKIFTRKGKHI